MLFTILAFSLLGAVGALVSGALLLAFPGLFRRWRTPLLAYAVGSLLGVTFFGLLPDAIDQLSARPVLATVLGAFLLLFALEKFLRLPHFHPDHGPAERAPAGHFILLGDIVHNFVDGVVIATAFLVSVPLGMVTALAILAHEIPQELGDFVVLLESGWPRWQAYWANALVALAIVPGALVAYTAREAIAPIMPYMLAAAAASFLYVAATDLAPSLRQETSLAASAIQFAFMGLGALTLVMFHSLLG